MNFRVARALMALAIGVWLIVFLYFVLSGVQP